MAISQKPDITVAAGHGIAFFSYTEQGKFPLGPVKRLNRIDDGSLFWHQRLDDEKQFAGVGYGSFILAHRTTHCYFVPLPYLIVVSLILPVIVWIQYMCRYPAGCCTHCGYDLRGSEGPGCPECGAAVLERRTNEKAT